MNDAERIADYIIAKCVSDKEYISNYQLQKILYLVQIAFYQKLDRPAFSDEIQAWNWGPVILDVYYKWCGFGGVEIGIAPTIKLPPKEERDVIDPVVEKARKMDPWGLREMVCREGGPWEKTYNSMKERYDEDIPEYRKYHTISDYLLANAKIDWTVS